jgi:sulfotransferase
VQLFPAARVICCVRNIAWIMDSVERLVRRNAFELSGMFGFESGGTVYSRVGRLASSDGLVGYALDALREAYFSEQASMLILVEYQALTRAPRATMQHLYAMLGEPFFEHDFDNVEYQAEDFDSALGARGLHTVKRKVEWTERQSVLPPGLFDRYTHDMFWREPEMNPRGAPLIRFDA